MARDTTPSVAVYVVWSPQLGATERHVPGATALFPDPRATHYWDPDELVGALFAPGVGTDTPAWDVWMLFDRDAMWREGPPAPAWWEHQLGSLPGDRHLEPKRFADHAQRLEAPDE